VILAIVKKNEGVCDEEQAIINRILLFSFFLQNQIEEP